MAGAHVVVLGAGPGGASAALWCANLGLRVTLLEKGDRPGGQLRSVSHPLDNFPGLPGARGAAVADGLGAQLVAGGVEVLYGHAAALDPGALRVLCADTGFALGAAAVVVATGTRRRALDVPGEAELRGRGVAYNVGDRAEAHQGQDVVVVGGGDDAFEHALLLAPHARRVTVVHRTDRYTARPSLAGPLHSWANVAFLPFARVEAIEGGEGGDQSGAGRVEAVRVRVGAQGAQGAQAARVERVAADAVFVCAGPRPNTEGLAGVATLPSGYVQVDRLQRTSRAGVYAVGDVCCPEAPTVTAAMGQGATAAKVLCAALHGDGPPVPAAPTSPAAPSPAETDRLRVVNLTLPARIGVYPRERRRTQTLSFELEFEVSAAAAAPADALPGTIDYAAVAATLAEVLGAQHFNLIETVAETVAGTLLARFASPRVRVRVTKPGVPQRQSSASIEVVRARRP